MAVACSVPPSPLVPRAARHFPGANACASVAACLVYLVVSVTVTLDGELLPAASVPLTVMVLPATEATVPLTKRCFAAPPEGGAPAGCLGPAHWPLTAGVIRTTCAVIAPPVSALSRVGCTATQLPAVTSVSWAGVTSVIFVDGVKSTVAFPACWVTWIASPDTEAIIPLTQALPLGAADGVDGDVAELVLPAAVEGWAVFDVVWDAPHAATE